MCTQSCIQFGTKNLSREEIQGKRVIEVGSLNVNGSLRQTIEALGPREYVGVDKAGEWTSSAGPRMF